MEYFLNDNFKLLKHLYNNKENLDSFIVIISQDMIAKNLNYGKGKVNRIINELIELGYLSKDHKVKGSYRLTQQAITLIETIETIKE